MQKGLDLIAMHGNWKVAADNWKKGYYLGYLEKASGWPGQTKYVRKFLKRIENKRLRPGDKIEDWVPGIRAHMIWKDNHDFEQADIKPAKKKLKKRLVPLKEDYPGIKVFGSPWLENRAGKILINGCFAACEKVLPKSIKLVNSGSTFMEGYINEVHHGAGKPPPMFFSMDGEDMRTHDIRKYKNVYKNAKCVFGWTQQCNGGTGNRMFRRDWLTEESIKRLINQMEAI